MNDGGHGVHGDYPCNPVENIEAIFRLTLPRNEKPENGSDSTRAPAFHDQHLSDTLRLKKTLFCPNLPDVFAMVAKDSLKKATFPPSARGSGWILAADLEMKMQAVAATGTAATGELEVVAAYHKTVFNYIIPIVSVLEFPSTSWDTQFLNISISSSRRGQRNNYALPDSVLRIIPDRYHESILPQSKILEDMKTVAKYFDPIVPFEFKSLSSGSYNTMLGILMHTLMDAFPWEGCSERLYCAYEHGPRLGRKPVTGDPRGFDALLPGLDLHVSDWEGKNREALESLKDRKKATKHGRDMLQQIWAQMVKCDATYSMLHAGNYELLLFRNRRDQTLYISDVIEPHSVGKGMPGSPGYYQIHIGLYISAIQDAIIRARQLKEFGGAENILPDTWTRPYDRGGKYGPAPTPELPFLDVMSKYMELCLAPATNESRSFHYIEGRPYRRSSPPSGVEKKFFFLETSNHATPNELIGTLIINEHNYKRCPVVVKVASGKLEGRRLFNEYIKHTLFSKESMRKQGIMIQKTYGLFQRMENRNLESILLLERGGKPVACISSLISHQKTVIQQTLEAIHAKGYVHGDLSRSKIVLKEAQKGRKRNGSNLKEVLLPFITGLGCIRREKSDVIGNAQRKELQRLWRWFRDGETGVPSPSWPMEIGPLPSQLGKDAKKAFGALTHWMPQEPWLQTARRKIKEQREDDWTPDTWLVVKFSSRDHVTQFQEEWSNRPPHLDEVRCEDTSFDQNSRESSQAYSPAYSGPDCVEGSQADSAMVVD